MTAKENELKTAKIDTACDCEESPSTELPQKDPKNKDATGDAGKTEKRTSNDSGALAGPNTKPTVPVAKPEDEKDDKD